MGREEQAAAGAQHPAQLVAPRRLQLLGEVREDGERIDEVEALVRVRERRREPVPVHAREAQVGAAPLHGAGVAVASGGVRRMSFPVPQHPAATAAEVEHGADLVQRDVRGDRVVRGAPAAEEPVCVRGAGDADHQPPRRERRAVHLAHARRSDRDRELVRAERGAEQAPALCKSEQSPLHGG